MKKIHSQNGFILVVTLWILAIIVLAAGFFSFWVHNALQQSWKNEQELQGEIDIQNTQAVLLFLLCTQHMTFTGLTLPGTPTTDVTVTTADNGFPSSRKNEIELDDRVYKGEGKARFSIQDEGGLLGVNFFPRSQMGNLLGLLGVHETDRNPLIDKMLDYTDRDDFTRLNGAESWDYEKRGLSPPPNRWFLTNWEPQMVMDWAEQHGLWHDGSFPQATTVESGGMPNLNTAPEIVLETFTGIDKETAERIIAARRLQPFHSMANVSLAAGTLFKLNSAGAKWFPSSYLRLSIWSEEGKYTREIHIRLTPTAENNSPWLIDYEIETPTGSKKRESYAEDSGVTFFTSTMDSNGN